MKDIFRKGGSRGFKHGKRLTVAEKAILKKEGHNPKEYLRERKDCETIVFIHRTTGKLLAIRY